MTASERWILSEYWVAIDRLSRFNEQLIDHRLRTPFAEVDLLLYSGRGRSSSECERRAVGLGSTVAGGSGGGSSGGSSSGGSSSGGSSSGGSSSGGEFLLIEVKTVAGEITRDVISWRQAQRLERARSYIEDKMRSPTRLLLATVRERPLRSRPQGPRDGEASAESVGQPLIDYFEAPFRERY